VEQDAGRVLIGELQGASRFSVETGFDPFHSWDNLSLH
jgi:hypothetical protein